MLLKQHHMGHPWEWFLIQKHSCKSLQGFESTQTKFEQFSVCFILLFQVLKAFQSQIITISNSNVNHHLYSTEWGWNDTSVNEIRKWPKAPELITQASEK